MKLFLYHGRKTVDEEMDDWGYDGPTIEDVNYLHDTYNSNLTISFRTRAAMLKAVEITGWWVVDGHAYLLQVPIIEGMIHTKDGFFGDWDFKDDDDAFWCWRRTVDVCAQLRLGLRVEDIEGSHELTRLHFTDGESPDEYVDWARDKFGLVAIGA